jgi:segregation and condensation protein A
MNLDEVLIESRKNKNYLLAVSLIELICKELDSIDEVELPEKVVLLSTLVELKSELLLMLFGLISQKKKTLDEEKDVLDIINILEKTAEKAVEKKAFVEKVSSREIPVSRLSKIVEEILEREKFYENKAVKAQDISVGDKIKELRDTLSQNIEIDFVNLMEKCESKLEVIVAFLAVLILAKNGFLSIFQEDNFSPIKLVRNEERRIHIRN